MATKMLNSRPVKMWIDGKIFNIQSIKNKVSIGDDANDNNNGEALHEDHLKLLDIKESNGEFFTSFRLPKLYYTKIQNLPHFDVSKLSEETQTKILYPTSGDGEISFRGNNIQDIVKAIHHIHSTVAEIRKRNIAMQFVCIPCLNANVQFNFENFKQELLSMGSEIKGLHESIFMCPKKLHITVDVYSLLDDREQAEAVNALNDYKAELEKILKNTGPIKLNINGLDCMNENAQKVDVLYAKVNMVNETENHNLQNIVNDISKHFFHRGLAKRYQENVKLHMTIINTKYRKDNRSPKRKWRRQSIDATKIFEKYKDYNFGDCDFDSLHLSHITLKGEDGFYKPIAVVKLDPNKGIV